LAEAPSSTASLYACAHGQPILLQDTVLIPEEYLSQQAEEGAERLAKRDKGLQGGTAGRRRAEKAPRESEERVQRLSAASFEGIFIHEEGKILDANEGFARMLGYELPEVIGRNGCDFLAPEYRDLVRHNVITGYEGSYEAMGLRKDGTTFPLEACGKAMSYQGHTVRVAAVRDITERKQAEETLRETEKRLRLVVSNAPIILFAADRDGIFALSEGRGLEALGLRPGEVVGLSIFDVFRDIPDMEDNLHRALAGEAFTTTAEVAGFTFETHCGPLRGRNGQVSGLIGVAIDVTERKRMEKALRESEAKYRQIFENVQDIFYRTNLEGAILELSPSVARYGYTREALLGSPAADLYENPEQRSELVQTLLERGEVTDYEIRLKTAGGGVTDTSLSGHLLRSPDGTPIGLEGFLRDITERKQMEEALRESEEKFRRIFDNVYDIYYRTDAQGIITDISPSVRQFGYTPEELVGSQVLDIYENPEERSGLLQAVFERGVVVDHEVHLKTGDGRVSTASVSTHLLRGPDGAFAGVEGSLRDITERKQVEEALRESEARYRRVFDNVHDLFYRTDAHGIITDISPSVERYGYTREQLIGTQVLDVYEDPEERAALLKALAERGVAVDHEVHLKTADGSVRDTSVSAHLLRGPDGSVIGVEGSLRDMSERKRMEKALRESEERYRSLVETSPDAIILADPSANIIMANRQAALLLGFESVEEMLSTGKSTFDFIAPEEREHAIRNVQETLESGTVRDVEHTLIRKDGWRFPAEMSASLISDAEGNPEAFIGVVRDITERKRAEEALREQVRRDPLTGTLNHAAIVEELRRLISKGAENSSHAVAMIDVNDLKVVNDTFGHQVGDEVLITVADALTGEGVLVGRYGGDEFVAILPNADREAAESYHQDVLASLEDVDLRDPDTGARVPAAVSVGFAIYPAEAERIEDLIKLADSAMYSWRRQRPVLSTVRPLSRSLGGERAAKMVGEIVPLLTSSGDLDDKLRLVAHRLSVGAGYDTVNFALIRPGLDEAYSLNTFAELPDQMIEEWNHEEHQIGWDRNPIRLLAERGRPIILDEPQHDQRLTDVERELLCAAGMQSAMVAPMLWRNELVGMLSVASKRKAAFGPKDAQFLMAVAAQVTGIVRMATLVGELQSTSTRLAQAQTETVVMLAAAAEAHDQATGLHLQNVRAVTKALASDLGYSEEDASELGLAAVLHDIGKIRVPDVVLSTAGQLTDPEWELMKQHTVWGGDFLAGRQGFELAATIARSHHERWDGSGYPDGLGREAIPKAATIVAVADAFDAMTSDRPYRGARSVAAAVREIVACSGGQFSPRVVQALVRLHKRRRLPRLRRQALGKLAA
jgi:diguanylate cyclase (GGDEF)-like protein/PAS domain S-box-containing protein